MKQLLGSLLAVVLLSSCVVEDIVKSTLYQYDRINKSAKVPELAPAPYSKIDVTSADGNRTVGWYYESVNNTAPLVMFFHGNVSNIESVYEEGVFEKLKSYGLNFAVFDYPKYGLSTGEPSEKTVVASAQEVYAFLKNQFPHSKFIIWGRSMGCAPATIMAELHPEGVDKLILTSPWDAFWKIVQYNSKLTEKQCRDGVIGNEFETEAHAKNIAMPVMIHHGTVDKIVPFERGKNLSLSFRNVNFISVEGKDHDNLMTDQTWDEFIQFVEN